jgi:two-component system response regulator YesN
MLKKLFKNRVYLSWLASYAVVLFIPLMIGSILYAQSIKTITDEVNRAHDASLDQIKTVIDSDLSQIERISREISLNANLRKIMYLKNDIKPRDYLIMYELQKQIIAIKNSNDKINGVYIYFKNGDYVLSNTKRFTSEAYESTIPQEFGMVASEWFDAVNSAMTGRYKIIRTDQGNGLYSAKIVYLYPVYGGNVKVPDAAVVITIDGNNLVEVLKNVRWTPDASISIIDEDNGFLSSGSIEQLPEFMKYEQLAGADPMFESKFAGDVVAVTHVGSALNDWKYVSVVPIRIFLEKVEYIKLLIVAYIVICLIIGCVIAYYFSRRNYRPLKRLTQVVSNNIDVDDTDLNEFGYIEKSLVRLLDEKASLDNRLAQQKDALRNNFLARLLKGRFINPLSVSESCKLYGIRFVSEDFAVLIFETDNLDDVLALDKPEDVELANLIIQHVNEEIFVDNYHGYMAEVDGRMCCLLNLSPQTDDIDSDGIKEDIEAVALKAIKLLENKFGLMVSVAISGIHKKITGIANAYSEASEVIEYKMLVQDINPVLHYDSLFSFRRPGLEESIILNKERQFTNCIINKEYKRAGEILNDVLVNNILKTTPSLQIIKWRIFGFLNMMINVMGEVRVNNDVKLFDDVDMVRRLTSSKSITEIQQQIDNIFSKLNEYYCRESDSLPISDKYEQIIEYVKQNYSDQNISVNGIAELFETSISSISRLFRKNMGMGLLDYIHKLRLEKAKELLVNTDLSIKDIAEQAGYYNDVSIIRAFKRYEAVTPGKYREISTQK